MKNGKARRLASTLLALAMLCALTAVIPSTTALAEVMPGTGVIRDATAVAMDDGTKIAETVTLRNVRTGTTNIPPPAPGAEWNFDYGGNSAIAVENVEPGTTYANGNGGWIKWANVDLKGGVASYKLCIASNGASRTFDVRISKPGEGLDAAVSLGRLTATGLATNWTARWVRFPAASVEGQNPPFIHANTNGYNPPAEDPSWATIADSKLDGICDVYYIFPNADSQFLRLSLTLKEEPPAPAGPYDGNLVFNVAPAGARAVSLQNLATGAALAPAADGRSFSGVAPGTYGYIASAPGYFPKSGIVDVTGEHTAAAPLIKNVLMWPDPAYSLSALNLLGSAWGDLNVTNTNGVPSWPSGGYVEFISSGTWFKWGGVDLKGGIASWESNVASGNAGSYGIELLVAPAGSEPAGASPARAIPASARSLGIQSVAVGEESLGWGAPGVAARHPAAGDIADSLRTGLSDVYVRFSGGDFNLGGVTLALKPDDSAPAELYGISMAARPYDAAVAVTSLDGAVAYQPQADGKTYSLPIGFYKYSATADGHIAKAGQVFMADKPKKVYAVLLPSGGENVRFEAEDVAEADRPGSAVQSGAGFSNGQAVALGAAENVATFSGISSEFSGIAEVKIRYAGAASGYVNVKANSETPKTAALDSSGEITVYMDIMDGSNSIRVSAAPAGFVLDYIDVWSLTTAGSVDPGEMDEPYVWTKNPVIKSIFTADPEAHVWPTDPDRLMLYPSHDRYPQSGCDRMDYYHAFSTTDLTHFEDEGEILRRADLPSWAIKNAGVNASSFMWAPDAAYYDGYYYFYNPVPRNTGSWGSTWETSVVRSVYPNRGFEQIPASEVQENEGKPWSGFIRDSGSTDGYANMYDVCVRVYDDRIYMYNGASQTLWQGELKSDMVTVVGGKLTLVSSNNQATANQQGDPDAYNRFPSYHEGPSAFRRNGIYYLIYPGGIGSVGGLSGDSFHYATSAGPLGPWTYRGVFFNPHGNTTSHGSVVEFKGEYYWVYHTGNLPDGSDQTRSVCMDKLVFDDSVTFDDGTGGAIVRFTRTFDGVQGLDGVEYERPSGVMYGPAESADASLSWGAAVTKNKDAAAGNGGWILNNVGGGSNADSAVTLTFGLNKAQRARLRFHYSTTSNMPHLNLTVNGKDFNTVNFPKTGGRSFFSDLEFTPGMLQAGENTLVLGGAGAASSSQAGGAIRLNYIEVIPLDEGEPTGLELRRSGTHVNLVNYSDEPAENVLLTYAIYDADGRLAYADSVGGVSVDGKRAVTKVFDVDLSQYEGCAVKAFAWDQDSYAPLCAPAKEIVMHNRYELGDAPAAP
jgi:beta-xylosidase